MEFDCCDSSKWYWRKHLEQNHHPRPRPMQDTKSLFFRSSQFILILAVVHAFPALAQTTPTALGAGTSTGSATQSATSPIPSNSPFLGGTPSGKATPDSLQLTLRDAIDRGLRYNLGLVLTGIASRSARAERLRTLSEMLPHLGAKLRSPRSRSTWRLLDFLSRPAPTRSLARSAFGTRVALPATHSTFIFTRTIAPPLSSSRPRI